MRVIPLSPILLLGVANAFVGLYEERDGGRGQIVELLLREVRQPMDGPWNAAFVHHAGYWSHYDNSSAWSSWPLPPTGDCNDLARFAAEKRILSAERPQYAEIFLLWSATKKQFVHTGIVAYLNGQGRMPDGAQYYSCVTIEGNTNEYGRLNGRGMHRTSRKLSPEHGDRFIRWTNLDARALPSNPITEAEVAMGRIAIARAA